MQKKVWRERAKDGGVIPVTGFPRVDDGTKRRKQLTFTGGYNIQTCNSYNTCIRSRAVVLGSYTFEPCLLKQIKFVEGSSGSSGSQVGEEVVVHVP